MTTLKDQAEALGITVNGRWTDETLQKKIDEAKGAHTGTDAADGPSALAASGAAVADDGSKLQTEVTPKSAKALVASVIPDLSPLVRLTITAQELNIEVDPEWDENRLRGEIQIARDGRADLQVKGAVPPKAMSRVDYDPATADDKRNTPVKLTRDYWDHEGNRIAAGTEEGNNLKLTRDEALRLINLGVAQRNDPLPA